MQFNQRVIKKPNFVHRLIGKFKKYHISSLSVPWDISGLPMGNFLVISHRAITYPPLEF